MSTRIRLIVLLLLLALTACTARTALRENQQKWIAQSVDHYRFDLTIGCFCPWRDLMPLQVEVKNGQVISLTDKTGQPTPPAYAETFNRAATIDGLFGILDSAIGSASKITVEYDADYGYPKSIHIDYSSMVTDDEINYTVENFEVVK
jgi:hypothetical protein